MQKFRLFIRKCFEMYLRITRPCNSLPFSLFSHPLCCINASLLQIVYEKTDNANQGDPLTLDELLGKLKRRIVEKGVYTRNCETFKIGVAELPLMIPSAMAGNTTSNTEMNKTSIYLTSTQEGMLCQEKDLTDSKMHEQRKVEKGRGGGGTIIIFCDKFECAIL